MPEGLQEPLQVVHTVDPRDAEQCIEKWVPFIHKEIGVIEKAVRRLPPAEVRSGGWLSRKEVKVVPSKSVFTVKPPGPAEASLATRKGQASTNARLAWLLVATTPQARGVRSLRFRCCCRDTPLFRNHLLQEELVHRVSRCHLSFPNPAKQRRSSVCSHAA